MGTHMCHFSVLFAIPLWSLNAVTMPLIDIIEDLQATLDSVQDKLTRLYALASAPPPPPPPPDPECERDFLMTRKEAAAFIGRTVRQLDRLCYNSKIHKVVVNGDVRIKRSELLRFKGYVLEDEMASPISTLAELHEKYMAK